MGDIPLGSSVSNTFGNNMYKIFPGIYYYGELLDNTVGKTYNSTLTILKYDSTASAWVPDNSATNTITITQPSFYSLNVDGSTAAGASIAAGGQSETISATFSTGNRNHIGYNLSSHKGMVFYVRQLPQTTIDPATIRMT